MIIHAGTTTEDFVRFLYRTLQDANFSTQVLDCVEELETLTDIRGEIDTLMADVENLEEERDALREALQKLVKALNETDHVSRDIMPAFEEAEELLDEIKRGT